MGHGYVVEEVGHGHVLDRSRAGLTARAAGQ